MSACVCHRPKAWRGRVYTHERCPHLTQEEQLLTPHVHTEGRADRVPHDPHALAGPSAPAPAPARPPILPSILPPPFPLPDLVLRPPPLGTTTPPTHLEAGQQHGQVARGHCGAHVQVLGQAVLLQQLHRGQHPQQHAHLAEQGAGGQPGAGGRGRAAAQEAVLVARWYRRAAKAAARVHWRSKPEGVRGANEARVHGARAGRGGRRPTPARCCCWQALVHTSAGPLQPTSGPHRDEVAQHAADVVGRGGVAVLERKAEVLVGLGEVLVVRSQAPAVVPGGGGAAAAGEAVRHHKGGGGEVVEAVAVVRRAEGATRPGEGGRGAWQLGSCTRAWAAWHVQMTWQAVTTVGVLRLA